MLLKRQERREPAAANAPETTPPTLSPEEMAEAYAHSVSDATALIFAHLSAHPEDATLDPDRNGSPLTLYRAVAASYPGLHDLGLTPTMWGRALSVALPAVREQAAAGGSDRDRVA